MIMNSIQITQQLDDNILNLLDEINVNASINLNILAFIYFAAFLLLALNSAKYKRKSIFIISFLMGTIVDILISYCLFQLGYVDSVVLIAGIIFNVFFFRSKYQVFSNNINNFVRSLHFSFAANVSSNVLSIYFLFVSSFFQLHYLLKIGLVVMYFINLILIYLSFINNKRFIKLYNETGEGFEIIKKKTVGNFPSSIPVAFLLPNNLLSVLVGLIWLSNIHKSKFNYGIYDTRNRIASITFNTDNVWQLAAFLWLICALSIMGFNTYSLYYCCLVIGIYRTFRFFGSNLSKYYTTIIGEDISLRPSVYDNVLYRVLPTRELSGIQKIYLRQKKYSYSLLFLNHEYLYDPNLGFVHFDKLVLNCHHLILKFSDSNSPSNFISEHCLMRGLQSPFTIIDSWKNDFTSLNLFGSIDGDLDWCKQRFDVIQKISDEGFSDFSSITSNKLIGKDLSQQQKIDLEKSHLRSSIVNSNSFESLKINIELLENHYSEIDHQYLADITGRGIYEFNSLFRQLHENPSISSRFIDLLNISECVSRYLIGIIHGVSNSLSKTSELILYFDTKAISYGSSVDFLRRFINQYADDETSISRVKIIKYLQIRYDDNQNIEKIIHFLKTLNPNRKFTRKPDLIELHTWLVEVRNKTRGHGTPSKVNFEFYVAVEKIILFMVAEFANLNFKLYYKSRINDIMWTFDMSHGGFPGIVPLVNKLDKKVHFNPFMPDDMIEKLTNNHYEINNYIFDEDCALYVIADSTANMEWIKCESHFRVMDGILYILNSRNDKNESWISFSTGKVIRPSIQTF